MVTIYAFNLKNKGEINDEDGSVTYDASGGNTGDN